jgi:signal transduction histidine kinase
LSVPKKITSSIDGVECLDNRLINHFFHDFKGKISTVLMCLETVKDQTFGPVNPAQDSWLERAEKNLHHMIRLINNFRDLTQMQEGTFPHEKEILDLRKVILELKLLVEPMAEERRQKIEFNIEGELCKAVFPGRVLERTLQDLFRLILDSTREEGTVISRVYRQKRHLLFDIAFESVEMEERLLRTVFDKYAQTRIGLQLGRGFTMLFCNEAVHFLGGEMDLKTWPGRGNRVLIKIPLAPYQEPSTKGGKT